MLIPQILGGEFPSAGSAHTVAERTLPGRHQDRFRYNVKQVFHLQKVARRRGGMQIPRLNIFRDDLYSGKLLRSGYRKEGRCSHMAFGVGPHLCPGAWISHQEAVEGSRILNKRMKNPRINLELQPRDPVEPDRLAPIGLVSVRELYIDYDLA